MSRGLDQSARSPSGRDRSDARHVLAFLAEQKKAAPRGYVICRCPHPEQLDERVVALPWHSL